MISVSTEELSRHMNGMVTSDTQYDLVKSNGNKELIKEDINFSCHITC